MFIFFKYKKVQYPLVNTKYHNNSINEIFS